MKIHTLVAVLLSSAPALASDWVQERTREIAGLISKSKLVNQQSLSIFKDRTLRCEIYMSHFEYQRSMKLSFKAEAISATFFRHHHETDPLAIESEQLSPWVFDPSLGKPRFRPEKELGNALSETSPAILFFIHRETPASEPKLLMRMTYLGRPFEKSRTVYGACRLS